MYGKEGTVHGKCELMCYYSICFSTIKSCNYWNDQIFSAISEHAMLLYQEVLKDGKEFTHAYMPKTINICGSDVGIFYPHDFLVISPYCNLSNKAPL